MTMTKVSIEGNKWIVDGIPTFSDIKYRGKSIEGLLLNARMVNAIFDDENPYTRDIWNYPDTGEWDADRNTNEFVAMLPCLLYTSPSPRDRQKSRMPSSA